MTMVIPTMISLHPTGVPGSAVSFDSVDDVSRRPRLCHLVGAFDCWIFTPIGWKVSMVPGLALRGEAPVLYERRRSKSVMIKMASRILEDLMAVADVVRDLMLPETDHEHSYALRTRSRDESKSAPVVNRLHLCTL
jgi:hypothetical protein